MGDGRAEGSSVMGDGGQAAISLMTDKDGMHVCILESFQLEGPYAGDSVHSYLTGWTRVWGYGKDSECHSPRQIHNWNTMKAEHYSGEVICT